MVYVLNKYGKPLMPTTRYGRVRRLLRRGHAVVVDYRPFTIQLTYDTPNGVQEVSLDNQASREVHGYRLMDSVEYAGRPCFVNARRQSGYFSLSYISGKTLAGSVSYMHLKLINHNNSNILEEAMLPSSTKDG